MSAVQVKEVRRNFKEIFAKLSAAVGLTDSVSLPSRQFTGSIEAPFAQRNWRCRSIRHIAAVLTGRGICNIIQALKKAGYWTELLEQPEVRREGVQFAVDRLQERWSPRLMVHLWDRLELSRNGCELLRHVLSHRYDPDKDHYDTLHVWKNQDDETDCIRFPVLPGRVEREREYARLADLCEINISDTGNCQRDASMAAADMYSNYQHALRTNFTTRRPAQPIFMFDGTGQSLGRGLCHAELGCADFIGDCMQSRKTLQPLQAAEGDDHALSIRDSMMYTTQCYNKLIRAKQITRNDGVVIPARAIATADMKAVKALTATSEDATHSVWCTCLAHEGRQHNYSKKAIPMAQLGVEAAYNRMIQFIESDREGPKCIFKDFDGQCCRNHMPPSVARGGPFTRFKCPDCGYNPTAAQWRKDFNEFNGLTDAEQKVRRKQHMENGQVEYQHNRHQFGLLFFVPMLELDFEYIGVDQLHLVYLNAFKHLFNYTIHQPMPGRLPRDSNANRLRLLTPVPPPRAQMDRRS